MEYTHRSPCDLPRRHHGVRAQRKPVGGLSIIEAAAVFAVALLLELAILSLFRAQSVPEDMPAVPVVVGSADSLWSIARAYPLEGHSTAHTVAVIRSMNDKSTSALSVGEILLVPAAAGQDTDLAQR